MQLHLIFPIQTLNSPFALVSFVYFVFSQGHFIYHLNPHAVYRFVDFFKKVHLTACLWETSSISLWGFKLSLSIFFKWFYLLHMFQLNFPFLQMLRFLNYLVIKHIKVGCIHGWGTTTRTMTPIYLVS